LVTPLQNHNTWRNHHIHCYPYPPLLESDDWSELFQHFCCLLFAISLRMYGVTFSPPDVKERRSASAMCVDAVDGWENRFKLGLNSL
jgi:hypothetical protein